MNGSGMRGPFRPGGGGRLPWIFGNEGPGAQRRNPKGAPDDGGGLDDGIHGDGDGARVGGAHSDGAPSDGAGGYGNRGDGTPDDGAHDDGTNGEGNRGDSTQDDGAHGDGNRGQGNRGHGNRGQGNRGQGNRSDGTPNGGAPGDGIAAGTIDFSRQGKRGETDGSEVVSDVAGAMRADPMGSGMRPETGTRASNRVLVEFYTKPGCHLCDDARPIVEQVVAEHDAEFVEHDITADDELIAKYGEYIPVVVVGGRQHTTWRVDRGMLARAIKSAGRYKRKRR